VLIESIYRLLQGQLETTMSKLNFDGQRRQTIPCIS